MIFPFSCRSQASCGGREDLLLLFPACFPDLLLHQAFQPGHKSGPIASPSHAGELSAASCSLFHVCLSACRLSRACIPIFWGSQGCVLACLQLAWCWRGRDEEEGCPLPVWAAYPVSPEQNSLGVGIWTRNNRLENGDGLGSCRRWCRSCPGLGTAHICDCLL